MSKVLSVSMLFNARRPAMGAAILAACFGVGACDVEPQGGTTGQTSDALVDETVVGTADVGYGIVRFHELKNLDGSLSVVMSEEVPNTYVKTPLDISIREGHTNLEMFKALLPAQAVPASLLASHEFEAAALGRANKALVAVHFNKDQAIEKSAASCAAWVAQDVPDDLCTAYTWGNGRRIDSTSGDKALHVGQSWSFATTSNVTMGICNESSVAIKGRIGVDVGGDSSSAYAFRGWATVNVGKSWRWFNFRTVAQAPCTGPVGSICIPQDLPSRYRIEGSSPAGMIYHLKTYELQSNPTGNNSCSCIPC